MNRRMLKAYLCSALAETLAHDLNGLGAEYLFQDMESEKIDPDLLMAVVSELVDELERRARALRVLRDCRFDLRP